MIIKLMSSIATTDDAYQVGDVVDWQPDAEATRYVKAGIASVPTKDEILGVQIRKHRVPVSIAEGRK